MQLQFKNSIQGCLGGWAVEHLPSAQGVIPGSQIESHIWLLRGACFSLCVHLCLSLWVSHESINKILKKKNKAEYPICFYFIRERIKFKYTSIFIQVWMFIYKSKPRKEDQKFLISRRKWKLSIHILILILGYCLKFAECRVVWDCGIPGGSNLIEPQNYHGFYLQKSYQVFMKNTQERPSHVSGSKKWRVLIAEISPQSSL